MTVMAGKSELVPVQRDALVTAIGALSFQTEAYEKWMYSACNDMDTMLRMSSQVEELKQLVENFKNSLQEKTCA